MASKTSFSSDLKKPFLEEEKKDPPRNRANTDRFSQFTAFFRKIGVAITEAAQPLMISSAAKECIKNLKDLPENPSPFFSIISQDCECSFIDNWYKTISQQHLNGSSEHSMNYSLCTTNWECDSLKEEYRKDLRQIAKHSKIADSLLEDNNTLMGERIQQEVEKIDKLFEGHIKDIFEKKKKLIAEEKNLFQGMSLAPRIAQGNSSKISPYLLKKSLALSDVVLSELLSQTYTGLSKIPFQDFRKSEPFLEATIRRIHPFIMKELAEFASHPNLTSFDLPNWLKIAREQNGDIS